MRCITTSIYLLGIKVKMDCLFCFGRFLTFISSKYILDSGAVSHSLNPSDSIGPPTFFSWIGVEMAIGGQLSAVSCQRLGVG